MRVFRLFSEGYIDPDSEFEYKQISDFREVFPLLHDHDYYEFFLIIKGSVDHFINQKRMVLKKGHILFIRPQDFHSYKPIGNDFQLINLAILKKTIDELTTYLGKGFDKEKVLNGPMPPMVLLSESDLSSILRRFEKLNTLPVNDKTRLNTELRVILVFLFSSYFLPSGNPNNNIPEWLNLTISEMQKPDNFKMGTEVIKEIACKSNEHISRSFKKYLNKTPTQFVNDLRLNFAANQIRFSSKRILDIAYEAGFENLSNFHRQFKSAFHHTPNDFRKLHYREIVAEKKR